MNRVFYFSGHRLTAFHWDRKEFLGACSFEPDIDGLDKFKVYLEGSSKTPARLLVDVIEEDFRIENAPHVYGKDKQAVISRLQDRYYRSSGQYVYSEVIGRNKTGRKDDEILIGGVTNSSLIEVWKSIIEECQVPLIGIWTLPLISKKILPLLGEKHAVVLLVTQQVNSNLRQTFFREGKMLSSRQSVINQDENDLSNIGAYAAPEIEKTVGFLRSQRLIKHEEVVHIHIIASVSQIRSLEQKIKIDELHDVVIHQISDLQEKAGLTGLSGKFTDGLFTWLCGNQLAFQAHYGKKKEASQYYYMLAAKALKVASVLVIVWALLIAESNLSGVIEHERSVALLTEQAEIYKKTYKRKFSEYEPVFKNARAMNAAVDMTDQITIHGKTSPLDFMIEISQLLSKPGLGVVHVDKIEWKAEQYKKMQAAVEISVGKADVTLKDPIRHVGVISGRIAISDKNYRGSVSQVNRIIAALGKHGRVEQVEALQMPVEVRSEKAFSDESGLSVDEVSSSGKFSLKVTMSEPGYE